MTVQTQCWHPAPDNPGGTKGRLVVTFSPSLSPERSAPPPTHPPPFILKKISGQVRPTKTRPQAGKRPSLQVSTQSKGEQRNMLKKFSRKKYTDPSFFRTSVFYKLVSCHLWLPLESCSDFSQTSHLMPLVCFIHSGTTRARFS